MTQSLDHQALAALLQRPQLQRLLHVLNGGGEETRIVGGAVRNALLSRDVTEVDLATTAIPATIVERALDAGYKPVPTGIDHGTITVVVDGEPFEVTSLREDVETDGRYAVVRFGRDFRADAFRRDFTINALSLGIDGRLFDYTNGEDDLIAGNVRFIGDAHARIREDFLRILRFFRFHAEYASGTPDAEGLLAASTERAGLERLSRERVRNELLKLLAARRARETMEVFAAYGFLTSILGGVGELGRFSRIIDSLPQSTSVDRLAALAMMTSEDAERLRVRLRLSNQDYETLADYAKLLAHFKTSEGPVDAITIRRSVAEHGVTSIRRVLLATRGEPRPIVKDDAWTALQRYAAKDDPIPMFPLRGADLIAQGLPKGPMIGELLARARQIWLLEGCPTDAASAKALLDRILVA